MWSRAFKDTLQALGQNPRNLRYSIPVFIASLILIYLLGGEQMIQEQIVTALATLVGGVLVVGMPVFLIKLIQAPVHIKYEKEKKPKLSVIDKYEEECSETKVGRVGLIVDNEGTDPLVNCHARLIGVDFESPQSKFTLDKIPVNKDIPFVGTIAGKSKGQLPIMTWVGLMGEEKTQIEYLDGTSNWLPVLWNRPIILLLHIWGDNSSPIYTVCKIAGRTGWGFDISVLKSAPLDNNVKLSDFQTITPDKEGSQT